MRTGYFRALSLLSTAALCVALPARADDQPASQVNPAGETDPTITVYGQRVLVLEGVSPENEIDEAAIAAYGANNVGELLDQVRGEVDNSADGPVILLNGRETSGVDEVSSLPPEAVRKIQVLPTRVAGQLGDRPTRRVINVVLKDNHRQVTANGEFGFATAGEGTSYRGELNLLRLHQGNRESLVLNAARVDPLFESDRNILSDPLSVPYDLTGNVVAYPVVGNEIDPALSALAGQLTRFAAVPAGKAKPTLADIASGANRTNFTDVRPYRTLLAESETYSATGNVTRHFGQTTAALNAKIEHTESDAQSGLASVLLRLPAGTTYSPFSRDVNVARYAADPLDRSSETTTVSASGDVSVPIGKWNLQATASYQHLDSQSDNEFAFSPAALQAAVAAGTVSPFDAIPAALAAPGHGLSNTKADNAEVRATLTGVVAKLPAGAITGALTANLRSDHFSGTSQYLSGPTVTKYGQDEAGVRASVRLPLLGDHSAIGNVAVDLGGAVRAIRHLGTLAEGDAGVVWRPAPPLDLHASIDVQRLAPSAQTLSDPVIVFDNYRIFDFVTGQTVLVRYLTGGNANLPAAERRIFTFGGTYRPWSHTNLLLTAEYTSQRTTDLQSTLPPVTADVQAAFPDRFIRNAAGTLITVDSRPVPFALQNQDQLHWHIDYHGTIGQRRGTNAPGAAGGSDPAFSPDGVRLNLSIDHSWTLTYERQARVGLPVVDLLSGGAIGYGGGVPRHVVRVFANVAGRGIGAQLDATWRSATKILAGAAPSISDIFFEEQTFVNGRLFADLGSLLPRMPLAKGTRLSVAVTNLVDEKQRVHDRGGATPIRYQPYLQDPLGRTITIGLRKVF